VVITEGDEPDGLYWILSGEADVYRTVGGVPLSLRTIGPGHCFGERAILEGTARSASVRAKSDLRALFVPADRFLRLHRSDPDVRTYFAHVLRSFSLPMLGVATQFAGLSGGGDETIFSRYELTDG